MLQRHWLVHSCKFSYCITCIIPLRLQKEVGEIRESVRILKDKLRQAEQSLVRLLKTKSALDQDIAVKENSLQIDVKYCMGMRKNMPMDPKVGPIFNMPLVTY